MSQNFRSGNKVIESFYITAITFANFFRNRNKHLLTLVVIKMIDEIDKVILSDLSKNARIPVAEIAGHLKQMEHKITESNTI